MATNKRKQDEKHLKILREMVALASNKQCFDCHQRGPTYVNMTIGSFVCTSCSGVLRGLNPPHRVKSISMASFTPEEMDFLKCHGNELSRKVYLGLYDSRTWPEPDSRDEQRVRDYMVQKYENKRWYVAPTEAMREEARRSNEITLNNKPQMKPLRSLLGESGPKLASTPGQVVDLAAAQATTSVTETFQSRPAASIPGSLKMPPATNHQTSLSAPNSASKQTPAGFDLLSDLGGDPFASGGSTNSSNVGSGFADFSNFDSMSSSGPSQPITPVPSTPVRPTSQVFTISTTPLQPLPKSHSSAVTTSHHSSVGSPSPSEDKYAALADLDSAFSTPVTTATSINWGGFDGGTVNWTATNNTAGTPSHTTPTLNWNSPNMSVGPTSWTSPGSVGGSAGPVSWNNPGSVGGSAGPVSWNNPCSAGGSPGAVATTPVFGSHSTTNHYGMLPPAGVSAFSPASSSSVSPFQTGLVGSIPTSTPTGYTGQFGMMTASTPAGYSGQLASAGSAATGFGQFPPTQNGGFIMTPSTGGFGVPAAFNQSQFMISTPVTGATPHGTGLVSQGISWGQTGAATAVSQPIANPFMNAAMHQVPPPSGSTNPFL